MVVEKGYKQTEIGVIPEDWKAVKIELIIKSTQLGGNYSNDEVENEFPLIKMGNLSRGKIKLDKIQYISKGKPNETDLLKFGDVLFNTRNTLDLVGKVAIWRGELSSAYFNSNIMRFNFNDNISSSLWVNLILNTPNFITQLRGIAIGTTSVAAIYNRDLFKLKIPLPPLPEQTAIANALSDMDALIAQTEKLIEKKKAIKQGVMQELLKPKDGWVTKKLGDYGKTYGGITGKTKSDFGKGNGKYIPFMNIMSNPIIDIGYLDKVDIKSSESQNRAIKGDLFFNGSSETPEEVGLCSVLTEELDNLYLNSFCFGYRMNNQNDLNGLFLSYLFRSPLGRNLIFSLAQGATRYNLSKTNLLKLELPIPSKKEQDIIALTLQDLDRSIIATQTKLTKLKHQKQGMMQALLTGKIRLI